METFFGLGTLFLATIMVFVALPQQIIKNHNDRKSGLTVLLSVMVLSVYIFRAGYSFLLSKWFIMVPDCFGIIFSLMLLYQAVFNPRIKILEKIKWVKFK